MSADEEFCLGCRTPRPIPPEPEAMGADATTAPPVSEPVPAHQPVPVGGRSRMKLGGGAGPGRPGPMPDEADEPMPTGSSSVEILEVAAAAARRPGILPPPAKRVRLDVSSVDPLDVIHLSPFAQLYADPRREVVPAMPAGLAAVLTGRPMPR